MSISLWIIYSFTLIFLAAYVIGLLKKITLLRDISSAMILPLAGLSYFFIIFGLLPDSYHTILLSLISYVSLIISQICNIFAKNKKLSIVSKILFYISILSWSNLYLSVFYIYSVSNIIIIAVTIFYILLCLATCILCGKKTIIFYLVTSICILLSGINNLFGFSFLIYRSSANTILLYLGTLLSSALVIFYILDTYRFKTKLGMPISFFLLIASQVLISYSNILVLN